MHKIYKSYGKWDIVQNLQQAVYSLIISQIIQVFISPTDSLNVYNSKVPVDFQ